MAGLYDSPMGILDPRTSAIMQTGMGLMAASGPSNMPVGLGQAMGQAGMQGIQALQQGHMQQIKMAELARAEEERKKREAAMAALKADPRFAGMGPLLDVAPQIAIDRAMPKPKETPNPFSRLNPAEFTPESLQAFQATNDVSRLVPRPKPTGPMSDLGKLEADYKAGLVPQGDYEAKKKKLTAPTAPLVTVDNRQDNEFNKAVGKEFGDQYAGLMRSDMNAPASIAKYQRLGSLLSQVGTGKFKGTTVELKAAAKGMGMDLGALGVADDVAPAQAATALANQLALEMRNPSGGAGMPGALSDKDREFLLKMIPSLESDPRAWPKMIEYRVKLAQREQQVARMARDYRKKNGKFDEGFFDHLQEWSNKNPIFPEPTEAPSGDGWSIRPK